MSIFVKNLLEYEEFQSAEIIAGASGLSNQIKRINLLGATTEELNAMEEVDIKELISEGDFYIAIGTFFNQKNLDFYKEFEALIQQKSAGLCIIGYKSSSIDEHIRHLCNKHHYPVIVLKSQVSFSNLIDVMMNSLIRSRLNKQIEGIVNRILNTNCSDELIEHSLKEIEPSLCNRIQFLHVIAESNSGLKQLSDRIQALNRNTVVFDYKESLFVLIHARISSQLHFDKVINEVVEEIQRYRQDVHIGISREFSKLYLGKEAMKQAMFASSHGHLHQKYVSAYDALTIDNWMYELGDSDVLKTYAKNLVTPIKIYEKEHEIELLETLHWFVAFEGSYKEIAKKLHLHENTVRYRIDKVKEILGMVNQKVTFYTSINLALRHEAVRQVSQKLNEKGF